MMRWQFSLDLQVGDYQVGAESGSAPFILIKGINHEKLNLYRTRAAVVEKISSEKIRRKELIMAVNSQQTTDREAMGKIIDRYPPERRYILAIMQDLQKQFNYLPKECPADDR